MVPKFLVFLTILTSILFVPPAQTADHEPVYLYGVQFTNPTTALFIADETYKAIEKAIAPRKLIIKSITLCDFDQVLEQKRAAIVITNSGIYRRHILNGWRDIATLATNIQPDPDHAVGSLLIARKGLGIKTLEQLKGKSIILNTPSAFQGTLTIKKELIDQGYDPEKFFGKIFYMGTKPLERMKAVQEGLADSTFLSTCFLERLKSGKGKDITEEFDLVHARTLDTSSCQTSTTLYPNFTILTSPNIDPKTIRKIAESLLKIPPNSMGEYWTIASDYHTVDNLYKKLKTGPYQYLNDWTLKRIWVEYRTVILLLILTLILSIWHIWRTGQVVKRATEEIIAASAEQRKIVSKTQSMKNALAIAGLSNMVAHELSQPLSAILLYAKSIKKILNRMQISEEKLNIATTGMIEQTERVNDIVKLVQKYAKTGTVENSSIKANEAIRNTVQNFIREHPSSEKMFHLSLCATEQLITIPRIEFELAITNLISNSYQALQKSKKPAISIQSKCCDHKFTLVIKDNSGKLTEVKFKNLGLPFSTSKSQGLGLGITIVKSILTRHYAQISFEREAPGNLVCTLVFLIDRPKGMQNENRN